MPTLESATRHRVVGDKIEGNADEQATGRSEGRSGEGRAGLGAVMVRMVRTAAGHGVASMGIILRVATLNAGSSVV